MPPGARHDRLQRVPISWRHAWGDLTGVGAATLNGGSTPFLVTGARLARNALEVDAGADARLGKSLRLGASYIGALAGHWSDHGVKVTLGWSF